MPTLAAVPFVHQYVTPSVEQCANSAAFNSFVSQLPAFSLVNLTGKTVDCEEGPVCIVDRSDLTFLGGTFTQRTDGSKVGPKAWFEGLSRDWPRNRSTVALLRSERVSFIQTRVVGPNDGTYLGQLFEEQGGFYLRHCKDVSLLSCSVEGVFGDAVCVIHEVANRLPCERITIEGLRAKNIGRNFVALVSVVDFSLFGLFGQKCGRSGLNIEPAVAANKIRSVLFSNVVLFGVGGATIGNLGASNDVGDLVFQDVRSVDKPLAVSCAGRVDQPGRRSGYVFERVVGGGLSNGIPFRISDVDSIVVRDVFQRVAGLLMNGSKVVYPGVGFRGVNLCGLVAERTDFLKGKSVAVTGDVVPFDLVNCVGVNLS